MSNPSGDRERALPLQSGIGPIREPQTLHVGSTASLAELREFLAQLKGRSPQDVIGIVSTSLLMQSMTLALLAVVGILAVFTVGPYIVYGPPQPKQATSKTTAQGVVAESNRPAAPSAPAVETEAAAPSTSTPDAAKVTKAMGLDETKPADPQKNPLDSPNLDKLLDGLDL